MDKNKVRLGDLIVHIGLNDREREETKEWDFKIDSATSVPRIFHFGKELTSENGYEIVDFKVYWKIDSYVKYPTGWDAIIMNKNDGKEKHIYVSGNKCIKEDYVNGRFY
ncbi:hypothetical protein OYT88_02180 [Sporolactobacillus sp. CQH2019]|uniref:hypothetical protein n=1 Tax=Sporolactobacillus sp. CQH2019 TaxID=3023512 RepID=UPI002367534E|nr:hypothetical protein [Sporolactobacillus sp. CQH2019]MDD9147357.1 hypothetical protein [Sporolactobacillus sp. CQH2019]